MSYSIGIKGKIQFLSLNITSLRHLFYSCLALLIFCCCSKTSENGLDGIIDGVFEVDETFDIVDSLEGKITDVSWMSDNLDEKRGITIYQPPNYDSTHQYGVLFVTDEIGKKIPYFIEKLIQDNSIAPILIIGLDHRKEQAIDTVFDDFIFDFRNLEFMNDESCYYTTLYRRDNLPINEVFENVSTDQILADENNEFQYDTLIYDIISNRYNKFTAYITEEVIPYVKTNYGATPNINQWTLGGFSSGGAFTFAFSCSHPNYFGNIISMSPGGPSGSYVFEKSTANYYCAAGKHEKSFHSESINRAETLQALNIPFVHKTYNGGHDWQMWLTFYLDSIKKIYPKKA